MDNSFSIFENSIATATGHPAKVISISPVGGGCINQASLIQLADDRRYFVKSNRDAPADMFPAECDGLRALRETHTIRVPEVIAISSRSAPTPFLILEAIEIGHRGKHFGEVLGRQLAELHRAGTSSAFGFSKDNYLGRSLQLNSRLKKWGEFWWTQRMEPQFKLASENGFGAAFAAYLPSFETRFRNLFSGHCPTPALIHGDLWSGNLLCDLQGQPVLIDPAAYYADREAELGMTTLFGGLNSRFYNAYDDAWPLPDGWRERVKIYRLYHLLNHLNLFGSSYLSGCVEIVEEFA